MTAEFTVRLVNKTVKVWLWQITALTKFSQSEADYCYDHKEQVKADANELRRKKNVRKKTHCDSLYGSLINVMTVPNLCIYISEYIV